MKLIRRITLACAGIAALALPAAAASASTTAAGNAAVYVNVKLQSGFYKIPPGDHGRGIRYKDGKIVLSTSDLLRFRMVPVTEPSNTNSFVTFYLRYGKAYLNVSTKGAKLGKNPQDFGSYAGGGFNGPRYILEAKKGKPLADNFGLTAKGKMLTVAFANPGTDSPNMNQVWGLPPVF